MKVARADSPSPACCCCRSAWRSRWQPCSRRSSTSSATSRWRAWWLSAGRWRCCIAGRAAGAPALAPPARAAAQRSKAPAQAGGMVARVRAWRRWPTVRAPRPALRRCADRPRAGRAGAVVADPRRRRPQRLVMAWWPMPRCCRACPGRVLLAVVISALILVAVELDLHAPPDAPAGAAAPAYVPLFTGGQGSVTAALIAGARPRWRR